MKSESQVYREIAINIENKQRDLTFEFRDLSLNANSKVFRNEKPKHIQCRTNLSETHPMTTRTLRPQTSLSPKREHKIVNPSFWVTKPSSLTSRNGNIPLENDMNCSHHFLAEFPENKSVITPRRSKTSAAKRIYRRDEL